jgi:hypothetical protein
MTKLELIFMIVTHFIGITNLSVLIGYLVKQMHSAAIAKHLGSYKEALTKDLNTAFSTIDTRFKTLETYVTTPKPSAVSSPAPSTVVAAQTETDPVVNPTVV